MANYGSFLWGDGTLWGAIYGDYPNIAYGILVDWNGNGLYDDGNESAYLLKWSCERGRDFYLNADGNGLEPVNVGKITLTLDNTSGRYDPFNTTSPLYPHILPGKKIKFIVQDSSTLTNHTIFTGEIEDIRPFARDKTVQVTAIDAMSKFKNLETTIALNTNIKISDAIEAVLDSISFTDYSIDSLLDVIAYWWVNAQKADAAIQELCDASFGTFFVSADGKAKYYTRSRAVSAVQSITQDMILKDIEVRQPWDVVRNNIDVIVKPLVLQATSTLWALRDIPSVAAGATIEIWGSFSYNNQSCPATNVITPVANTDYSMSTVSGGGGTDLTASFTVTTTKFGEAAKFVIKNNSASIGYINLLKIRGDALTAPDPVRINSVDSASAALYGNRTFRLESKWLQNTNLGITLAETIKELLSNARKYPIIQFESRPDMQYTADLFDRINLAIAALGIDSAFRVGSIKHESGNTPQTVVTTVALEPVVDVASVYWIFPTELGVTSYLA